MIAFKLRYGWLRICVIEPILYIYNIRNSHKQANNSCWNKISQQFMLNSTQKELDIGYNV